MVQIAPRDLRNNLGDLLRRAETGEEFTIIVAGHPVAQLGPPTDRRWVSGPPLRRIFTPAAPETLAPDIRRLYAELSDPFE